ncbi:hypothetical protein CRG98_022141 [Punica granatum]|uniref:Uncharacterized protein n=1 Tax=Punica granatum TaxID=22663 RepID=A0A2I0JNL3_PUNGR|nr:hypothetical protein CRG98_022141 [Punica granatum]
MKKRSRSTAGTTSNDAFFHGTGGGYRVDTSGSSSASGQRGYEYDVFLSFRGEDTRKGFTDCLYTALEDVREISGRSNNGLRQLQSQLVADLLKCDRPEFATIDEGISVVKRRFREMKVLILLDDVDSVDQLKALAAELDWFGQGSRIIITTRNKGTLEVPREHQVYEVNEMEEEQGLQLFCKHALRRDAPTVRLRALSEEIVKRIGGLPLALEVIGSFLHGKSEDTWKATLQKLKIVPNKEVEHRGIVRQENPKEPGKRSRLWGDEAVDVLLKKQGSKNIEAIQLEYQIGLEDRCFEPSEFRKLSKLRFLQLDCANLAGNFENLLPTLRWLRWKIPSLDCTATNLNVKDLLILDLSNSKVIDPSIGKLKHLASLNMTDCRFVKELLEQLDINETLLELVIDGTGIKKLPTLDGLMKLETLSANNCACLTQIPSSIGHLTSLADLRLDQSKISELPESIGSLVTLRRLTVAGTPLRELPKSIGGLNSLVELLRTLPALPSSLSSVSLTCESSVPIPNLPDLINLKKIEFVRSVVPKEILELSKLEKLHISRSNVSILLDGIGALATLKELSIGNVNLQCLPELPLGLRKLCILRCHSLARLTALSNLQNLSELKLHDCPELVEIESLGDLATLRILYISFCRRIAKLDGLDKLESLKNLVIYECGNLERLPDLSKLSALSLMMVFICEKLVEILVVSSWQAIETLNVSNLKSLAYVDVRGCTRLKGLDGLDKLGALMRLNIAGCKSIEKLPDLSNLKSLQNLNACGCEKLQGLDGLDKLGALTRLSISGCKSIERLPDLSNLKSLQHLVAYGCEKLQGLDGLDKLGALTWLSIGGCKSIERLPDLSNLKSLQDLGAYGCEKLQGLDGLDKLGALTWLSIGGCKSIERLPDLSNLKSLQDLDAHGCEKLQGLDGLDKLGALTRLSISGCKSIEKLPNLSNLRLLEIFRADGCEKLQEVEGLKKVEEPPTQPKWKLWQCLDGNGIEKLQELDGLDELRSFWGWFEDRTSEKLLNQSNYGVLRQWYADGCEKGTWE